MRLRIAHRWLLALIFSALLVAAMVDAEPKAPGFYSDLLLSDLIVRGHVTSIVNQSILAHEFDPNDPESDGYFYVLSVDMEIDEVLKGYWDSSHLNFVINISRSGLARDYSADDEILIGLMYLPELRNGTYTLQMSDARFVRMDDLWAREGAKEVAVSLDNIRAAIAPTLVPAIAKSASSVVLGNVTAFAREDLSDPKNVGSISTILVLTVNVTDALKGNVPLGEHKIRCFAGGPYWPNWAGHGPLQIDIGPQYCMFLTDADGELTIVGGANGLYQVGNDGRLKHNRLEIPLKVPAVRKMMEE